jgi:hypothetical protein
MPHIGALNALMNLFFRPHSPRFGYVMLCRPSSFHCWLSERLLVTR